MSAPTIGRFPRAAGHDLPPARDYPLGHEHVTHYTDGFACAECDEAGTHGSFYSHVVCPRCGGRLARTVVQIFYTVVERRTWFGVTVKEWDDGRFRTMGGV